MFDKAVREHGHRYGATEAASAAGISLRQLYYWERLGLLRPAVKVSGLRRFRRYSERDLECLRAVKRLIDDGFRLRPAIERAAREAEKC